jgi:hypothetical protein
VADITDNRPISGRLQALVLSRPIEVWTDDDATSGRAYTEQTPRPALPQTSSQTYGVLQAEGDVTGTSDYDVRAQHGGLPGLVDHGATIAARRDGEPLYLGWEQSGALASFDLIDTNLSVSDIKVMPDGTLVICGNLGAQVKIYTKSPGATSWTDRGTVTTIAAGGSLLGTQVSEPCLLVVEDVIYLLAWREGVAYDPVIATKPNRFITVWGSSDNGATWALVQDYATTEEDVFDNVIVPGDPSTGAGTLFSSGRIRAAYRDGEVCVLCHLIGYRDDDDMDVIRQYAGPSLAHRLDLVEDFPGAAQYSGRAGHALPDIVATPTGFAVAWIENGKTAPQFIQIGSAWQPLSSAIASDVSGPFDIVTDGGFEQQHYPIGTAEALTGVGELALTYDPSGVLWCLTCAAGSAVGSGVQYAYYSTDGGSTWTPGHATIPAVTDISGYWFYPEDLASGAQGNRPTRIRATWWRGSILVSHTNTSTVAGFTGSYVTQLGGWSDLTLPFERHGVKIGHRQGWLRTYLPFELPEDQLYTATQTGTQTSALSNGAHAITTGSGGGGTTGVNFYKHVGVDNGLVQVGCGEIDMAVAASEGTGASLDIAWTMRLASTTHGCEVAIVRTPTGIFVRDNVALTPLGNATGLVSGSRYVVRWGMKMDAETGAGRNLQVWYRRNDGSTPDRRRWNRIGSFTLANDNGAGGVVPHLEWGHIANSGATTQNQSTWFAMGWAFPYSSTGLSPGSYALWPDLDQAGGDNPGILPGRPLGTAKGYCLDGLELAGRRGPFSVGDQWKVTPSGEYEIARALTLDTPTRRIHHRTEDTSAQVVIPWAVDAARPGVEDTEHPPMMALHISCNWRTAYLEYLPQGGAWTQAASIDTAILDGVSYTRIGRTLRASATGSTVYLHRDEVGPDWTVEWDDGAGTDVYRHLAGNSPGRWSSSTSEPRARLELESTESGDPTTGGTLSLWSPSVTVLVAGVTATAWRLRIPTQPTADGDLRTKLAWCDVHPFALPPSWGRGFTAIPGHDRVQLEGDVGVRVSRAPASRELRIAWDEGVDESDISGSAEVRYVTPYSSGSEPAASLGEIPRSVVSMLERQDGRPVGWVAWDRTASGAVVIRRQAEQLWGTVESAPDLEVVLGDVGETEVVRVATLTIREEV